MAVIKAMPSWVKQVLYLELRQELREHFSSQALDMLGPEDSLALFVPKLTPDGERLTSPDSSGPDAEVAVMARDRYTVLDMCLRRNWTLEECCINLRRCIQSNIIKPPSSTKAAGTLEYLSNGIRLGEYLVKMGRITPEQLQQALRTQQYIEESMHEHTGLANILINLGYITRQDTEGILFLKEESRKPIENAAIFNLFVASNPTTAETAH